MKLEPTSALEERLLAEDYSVRLRAAVSWAWRALALKIVHGEVHVNREASLQLHYAACLQQVLPLVRFRPTEMAVIELEAAVHVGKQPYNIDVLLTGTQANDSPYRIAIEMKCYRVHAASGGKRGATDIFMKDVYEDLAVLEAYCNAGLADVGIALVMNEHRGFVFPASKTAKCWTYDISHGAKARPGTLDVAVGGREVNITLGRHYQFEWESLEPFFFMEVEGTADDRDLTEAVPSLRTQRSRLVPSARA